MTSRIANRSLKRAKQEREYAKIRKEFLEDNPNCAVHADLMQLMPATQIHHMKGKIGDLLTNVKFFLPVCAECHQLIELHAKWAKEQGYSLSRLSK